MALTMRRDPFAGGEYERVCYGPGQCAWCGQTRPRVFTYVWVRDDREIHDARPSEGQAVLCVRLLHSLPLVRRPPCRKNRNSFTAIRSPFSWHTRTSSILKVSIGIRRPCVSLR